MPGNYSLHCSEAQLINFLSMFFSVLHEGTSFIIGRENRMEEDERNKKSKSLLDISQLSPQKQYAYFVASPVQLEVCVVF